MCNFFILEQYQLIMHKIKEYLSKGIHPNLWFYTMKIKMDNIVNFTLVWSTQITNS